MFKLVMATLIKFVILLILPSLLSPTVLAEISVIETVNFHFIKNQTVIGSESQCTNLAITSEAELKESNNETESHNSLSLLSVHAVSIIDLENKLTVAAKEFLPAATSFLSYLSLLSTSPPKLS